MNDQYMLPGEFVAVVIFLFAPPLIIGLTAQTVFFWAKGIFARKHTWSVILGYFFTVIGSLTAGAAIYQIAPRVLAPILRVRDISIAKMFFPVMPLAFIAVALVAPVAGCWVNRIANKKA